MSTKRERRAARREEAITSRSRRRLANLVLIALGLALIAYFVYIGNRPADALVSEEVLALGARVYAENCASCHGDQGQGHVLVEQAPALDSSEHAWHHPDGQIQQLIEQGGTTMPAFGDKLDQDEIFAVIRFIQTWWTAEQLAAQQEASQNHPLH